jgi:hypothetical protein
MKKVSKASKVPMAVRAEEAFKKAVASAIAEHKKAGHSIAIWRDGKVVHIPPDQIEIRENQAEYAATSKKRK